MFHMRQFSAAAVLVQAICSTSRQFKTMQKLKSTLHVLQDLTRNHLKNSGAESAGFLFAWRRFLGFDFGIAPPNMSDHYAIIFGSARERFRQ
jgi:hypothetical protein